MSCSDQTARPETPNRRRDRVVAEATELASRLSPGPAKRIADLVDELHWAEVERERARSAYEALDASYRLLVAALAHRPPPEGVGR